MQCGLTWTKAARDARQATWCDLANQEIFTSAIAYYSNYEYPEPAEYEDTADEDATGENFDFVI